MAESTWFACAGVVYHLTRPSHLLAMPCRSYSQELAEHWILEYLVSQYPEADGWLGHAIVVAPFTETVVWPPTHRTDIMDTESE